MLILKKYFTFFLRFSTVFSFVEELVLANKPVEDDFWQIEKVLKKKKEKGKTFYLVKYLGYDNRFNAWVEEKDMVEGEDATADTKDGPA